MADKQKSEDALIEVAIVVRSAYLIYRSEELLEPLADYTSGTHVWTPLVKDAAEGLHSVVSAATLPFQLILDAVQTRRFDRFLSAEHIRNLNYAKGGDPDTPELKVRAHKSANEQMCAFLSTTEGFDFIRDGVVYELDRGLHSPPIKAAATELLVQTLVSTWAVFETFARSFIIAWVNADPRQAQPLLSSPDLRDYFGKQVVDISVIGDHGFDLTGSMGTILFRNKRLDNLAVIRSVLEAAFADADIRSALGDDLWMLNQRRHLFVHKRGWVDDEYLTRTGDKVDAGERLVITSDDVRLYLLAVQRAIIAIATPAERKH